MKTKTFLGIFVMMSSLLYSCNKEVILSDKITKEQKSLSVYTGIDVSDALTVRVSFTQPDENIIIETNENLHKYLIIEKVSDKVVFRLKDHIDIEGDAVINVYLTAKGITDFLASDASRILIKDTLYIVDMNIRLSNASRMSAIIIAKNLAATLRDASSINLSGYADSAIIAAYDASTVKDYALECGYLKLKLTEASNAFLSVSDYMDVTVSDASTFKYKGTGVIRNSNVSGASEVHKVD